jgi:hypothetical protein
MVKANKSTDPVCKNCGHEEKYHINPEQHNVKERRCTRSSEKGKCECIEYRGE